MQTKFIQAYLQLPGVREALQLLRQRRVENENRRSPMQRGKARETEECKQTDREDVVVNLAAGEPDACTSQPAPAIAWPASIIHYLQLSIKEEIVIKDYWPSDRCKCYCDCYADTCPHAAVQIFCEFANCAPRGRCSNGVYEHSDVELITSANGVGVRIIDSIPVGTTIVPYTGLMTNFEYDSNTHQFE
ncbi:hypothetical protein GN958_ATG04857 [Phytophthora infestans]|uniref:SET domain-containing protein n=1 Tax=Phytophthora infestans TaxID=4787 RepID=A0A8S9V416_PHYIN|nr:hypothetical protein GN958_ATG19728 [Phytophthora infestans]KAF4145949.1 hypothetical protein GN958_ATG04857 [Phytophthora infestans]